MGFALAGILFNASRKPSKPDDTILQLNEKLQKFFEQTMHAELDSTSMGRMFKSIRAGRRVAEVIESVIYLSSQVCFPESACAIAVAFRWQQLGRIS